MEEFRWMALPRTQQADLPAFCTILYAECQGGNCELYFWSFRNNLAGIELRIYRSYFRPQKPFVMLTKIRKFYVKSVKWIKSEIYSIVIQTTTFITPKEQLTRLRATEKKCNKISATPRQHKLCTTSRRNEGVPQKIMKEFDFCIKVNYSNVVFVWRCFQQVRQEA